MLPSATGIEDDKRLRGLRKDAKVSAVLHTGYPVRYWDHDIGPELPHLLEVPGAGGPPACRRAKQLGEWFRRAGAKRLGGNGSGGQERSNSGSGSGGQERSDSGNGSGGRDLTPDPGQAMRQAELDVSRDGRFVVTSWHAPGPGASIRGTLVRIDVATGDRVVIAADPDADLGVPAISPDGTAVAFTRETVSTPQLAPRITLCVMRFSEEFGQIATDWDRWPASVTWSADGATLVVTADEGGRCPVFTVYPATSAITRITHDDFSYSDVRTAPDGVLYALRSSYAAPPHPVRIDPDGTVTALPCVELPSIPGEVTEVTATSPDGTPIRGWLVAARRRRARRRCCCGSMAARWARWNAWTWRWNPWLVVAQGYAVLLPDPALSTGYGQDFIAPRLGRWGAAPYTDLMAITDAVVQRPRHRRDPHGRDGRLVRRLHGQLGRRPHRPIQARSSPTPACGRSTSSARPPTPRSTGAGR